jgi:isoquinoline 1-oxidoreductase alpha subunit
MESRTVFTDRNVRSPVQATMGQFLNSEGKDWKHELTAKTFICELTKNVARAPGEPPSRSAIISGIARHELPAARLVHRLFTALSRGFPARLPCFPANWWQRLSRRRNLYFVPVMLSRSRSTQSSGISGSASTVCWRLLISSANRVIVDSRSNGCGIGLCGACTVQIDGVATRSCQTPIATAAGKRILTIEGLAANGPHPIQDAWIAEQVQQCGYCQPGQIMSAAALLAQKTHPTDADIDEAMAGNLCRCATYFRIRNAIHRAAGETHS